MVKWPAACRMKRFLIVTEYPGFQPQAMVRALQYRPFFEQDQDCNARFVACRKYGVERIMHFIDRHTNGWFRPWLFDPVTRLVTSLNERRIVRLARSFDLVYVIKVRSLSLYRNLSKVAGLRIVKDFGDALWLPCHQGWGWQGLDEMLRLSCGVICENGYVEEYARHHNPRTYVVEDTPQVEDFDPWRSKVARDPSRIVLGWIGTGANACCLYAIWEVLEKLFIRYPHLHLRIVGAQPGQYPRWEHVRCTNRVLYDQEVMVREALAMDIGLFPHFDVIDAHARGNLKAKIYMAGGVAAVCQNLGENPKLIQDGVNGLLASSLDEWHTKLDWLITHKAERERIAQAGLQTVRTQFSRQASFLRLKTALLELAHAQ
jgi:glycosyltransferase involved in cell wall biosynthesis